MATTRRRRTTQTAAGRSSPTPTPAPRRGRSRPSGDLVAFRRASVTLADDGGRPTAHSPAAEAAAGAIVAMAQVGDEWTLRHVLSPDDGDDLTWTVACYRIGDLTPSELADFSRPVPAVEAVAACADPAHVAAELVVSTPDGVRWTALFRTGTRLSFQLPTEATASDGSGKVSGRLDGAIATWAGRLERWREDPEEDVATEGPVLDARAAGDPVQLLEAVVTSLRNLERGVDEGRRARAELDERLERIEAQLKTLIDQSAKPKPTRPRARSTSGRATGARPARPADPAG